MEPLFLANNIKSLVMNKIGKTGALLLLLVLGLAGFPAHQARAQAEAILVLDASGSMWGQIDGKNKITIAREVVADMMKDWEDNAPLGLIVYGHRSKGDCADIQTLVPIGADTATLIAKEVRTIKPKGMTPLSASVKKAAEILKYTEQAATVILLTDGEENCNMDPCALGKELAESGVDFKAHVIAFDMKDMDVKPLQCLAESTGGQFLAANNAGDLRGALNTVAQAIKSEGGDRVSAIVDDDGTVFTGDVYWHIFKADAEGKAEGDYLAYGASPAFIIKQPPGRYVITGKTRGSEVSGKVLIEVKDGEKQEHILDLRSGTIILRATINGEAGRSGTYWDLQWHAHEILPDGTTGKRIASGVTNNVVEDKAVRLRLPPGTYRIEARFLTPYRIREHTDISIAAGQETSAVIDFATQPPPGP
jgi:Ca-activated chloride channel family protein